jgi:hypothetical protein
MRLNEVETLNVGDIVYNIYQEELVINSINLNQNNVEYNILCVNTGLFLESYPHDLLYKTYNDLCDEELSFIFWAVANKNLLLDLHDNDVIKKIKLAYMQGYARGFESKPRCSGGRCKK